MSSGITLIPDISQNTGISSGFAGISNGADISGNNPNPSGTSLLAETGAALLTESGGTLLT